MGEHAVGLEIGEEAKRLTFEDLEAEEVARRTGKIPQYVFHGERGSEPRGGRRS
jgi:hypothetical protein